MHTHEHDHLDLEEAPSGEVDSGRDRLWRLQVLAGAIIGAAAFVGWPAWHVLTVYRPLRRIQAADATLGLAWSLLLAAWLLTATPQPIPVGPHRVGQWVLRVIAGLTAVVATLTWWAGRGSIAAIALDWATFPLTLLALGLGFAYIGRLHRLFGQRRLANLSDLAGLVLPLLWAGSQLVAGYPGPWVWGPGIVGLGLDTLCLLALIPGAFRRG